MQSSRFNTPRILPAGGTIGIFSPAGSPDAARLACGVSRLEQLGYTCVVAPHAAESFEYFSAPDEVRLADFHALLTDPTIDMLMMSRGGYGLSRIVHRIDWQAVAASKKLLCGFSDFTAINLAALAMSNTITLAGPGVASDFGDAIMDGQTAVDHQFMQKYFWPIAKGETVSFEIETSHPYAKQCISGPIWGSNLSLVSDLGGSRFIPDIQGGIMFFEEIGEKPYVVERMLLQLYHAGILTSQRAIVLGEFTSCEPDKDRFSYGIEHVVKTLHSILPIPVLTGLPFGHVGKKLTIPYGADCTLDIRDGRYQLTY